MAMIEGHNVAQKEIREGRERQSQVADYYRSARAEYQLDRIAEIKERYPDRLRKRVISGSRFMWYLEEETLLCLIDQYREAKDEDVVNSLCHVLFKKSLKILNFFKNGLSAIDKPDLESHVNYVIACAIDNKDGKRYRFARFQYRVFLKRQVMDALRKSADKTRKYIDDVERYLSEEERSARESRVSLIEKQVIDKDEINKWLNRLDVDKCKKQAFLLKTSGGLTDEDIAPFFGKKPDTIRKWRDEVMKLMKGQRKQC